MNRILNWKHGPKSPLKYSLIAPKLKATLPVRVNLKPMQSPVHDQGKAGSCTGNGIANALEFLQLQELRKRLPPGAEEFGVKYNPISRLFIYYNERVVEGNVNTDAGSSVYTGVSVIQKVGFCQESLWPYDLNNLYTTPSSSAYSEAAKHKAVIAYSLNDGDLNAIKTCLASGFPVVFGTDVCASFMNIDSTGVYLGPSQWEQPEGGHCMLIVGYDDHYQSLSIKNSWGTDFGDRGYVYANYSWAAGFGDMHTIRK